jgi:hypothetical protein
VSAPPQTLEQAARRIRHRAVRDTATGCLVWPGTVTNRGYGEIKVEGKRKPVHRVLFEVEVGPIAEGLQLDHLCRNRLCVNPAHLEPVTHIENVLRGESPPARNARKTHCAHGHQYTPANTYATRDGRGRRCRTCEIARQANLRAQGVAA